MSLRSIQWLRICWRALYLLIQRSRTRIHSSNACLIDDAYLEVVYHSHLTGKADVLSQLGLHGQTVPLEVADFARIARKHLDATSRAFGIATATMQYVYSCIFYRKHKLASALRVERLQSCRGFSFNPGHLLGAP